jgi:RND family efflux transporter MFP subunit
MNKCNLALITLAAVLISGCGEKKKNEVLEPVLVKTMILSSSSSDGVQGYSGTVEEMNGSMISFNGGGTIEKLCVAEGQTVRKGQLIATVNPVSVRNSYNATLAARQQAEDAYSRMKQLHDKGSLPEIKWVEVQSKLRQAVSAEQIAQKGLRDCNLYAPFSGYVSQKIADVGQNVAPGAPVVKIVEIGNVKVKVSVPEDEISKFRNGQTVRINVSALNGRSFIGRVTEKGVSADPISRTYDVKATVANPGHVLLPGMICTLDAGTGTGGTSVSVPSDIIQIDFHNNRFVWTVVNGKAHKTAVETGEAHGENVNILSGLAAGDKVIVEGQQKVSEGMGVKE